jgi:hypothetical protein
MRSVCYYGEKEDICKECQPHFQRIGNETEQIPGCNHPHWKRAGLNKSLPVPIMWIAKCPENKWRDPVEWTDKRKHIAFEAKEKR